MLEMQCNKFNYTPNHFPCTTKTRHLPLPIHASLSPLTDDNITTRRPNNHRIPIPTATSTPTARRALLPRDMQLLRERDRRIIIAQLAASRSVLARQRNAVVNIEDAVGAARRPDSSRSLDGVLLCVDLAVEQGPAAVEGGAGGLLGCVC